MRGKPGTQIVLTIARKDVDAPLTFTLTREIINFRSVRAKLIEPGYGYIRVVQFQEHTGEDVAKAIRDLYKQGELSGLVLDLRSDPGGLLNVSVGVAAAFLPADALVVYTDGRTPDARMRLSANKGDYLRGRGDDYLKDLPRGGQARARWSCWSMAAPRRRRKSSPARCRTTSAPWSWARRLSARVRCRPSCRWVRIPASS